MHSLREHYVRTVRPGCDTLEERRAEAVALVGDRAVRVWRLYLAGAALAFEESRMGVDQILAGPPRRRRGESGLPRDRRTTWYATAARPGD